MEIKDHNKPLRNSNAMPLRQKHPRSSAFNTLLSDPEQAAKFILFSQREFLLNLSAELSNKNLSYSQFMLLDYLNASQPPTMTDIARKVGHSTAAVTGLVDRLERLGHVERVRATGDRRKTLVRVTTSGAALMEQLQRGLQKQLERAVTTSSNTQDLDKFMDEYHSADTSHPKTRAKAVLN